MKEQPSLSCEQKIQAAWNGTWVVIFCGCMKRTSYNLKYNKILVFIYMQMENRNVWKIMDEYSLDKVTCLLFNLYIPHSNVPGTYTSHFNHLLYCCYCLHLLFQELDESFSYINRYLENMLLFYSMKQSYLQKVLGKYILEY